MHSPFLPPSAPHENIWFLIITNNNLIFFPVNIFSCVWCWAGIYCNYGCNFLFHKRHCAGSKSLSTGIELHSGPWGEPNFPARTMAFKRVQARAFNKRVNMKNSVLLLVQAANTISIISLRRKNRNLRTIKYQPKQTKQTQSRGSLFLLHKHLFLTTVK